ncbi:hypothetical protein O0555_02825 [Brevibacillus laterosporus]|uniref:hypothetical protein n=1 Tax=Brevibacillus laterosporus TaxID=1465 RepID=UPI0018CF245A|nr:hypothetical protein [Brevibacillus laterosporus]MBG9797374.1 hypothetical protein [Brevibacillus laterosporus]MCR8936288.1 hypothetical protein [Brevibacillus laterosporus]MCZ0838927.1 hypothetical protein [Brevibacillus laterosporus]MCZ0845764.1 hypothetical protein [Brevibacillus laterosporus]MED1911426.1 hypothetical protein [Brevibacillus laterosporus]
MYVKQRYLWLLLPILVCLFGLGALLGQATDKLPVAQESANESIGRDSWNTDQNNANLKQLIDQLFVEKATPFGVKIQNQSFVGSYRGNHFQLKGTLQGKKVKIERNNRGASFVIDNEQQELNVLPYALFTPSEHASLLKDQFPQLQSVPLVSRDEAGLQGFSVTLQPDKVNELLREWLGPSFPAENELVQLQQSTTIKYQLWYDDDRKQLKRMVVLLQLKNQKGDRSDQLIFNF